MFLNLTVLKLLSIPDAPHSHFYWDLRLHLQMAQGRAFRKSAPTPPTKPLKRRGTAMLLHLTQMANIMLYLVGVIARYTVSTTTLLVGRPQIHNPALRGIKSRLHTLGYWS